MITKKTFGTKSSQNRKTGIQSQIHKRAFVVSNPNTNNTEINESKPSTEFTETAPAIISAMLKSIFLPLQFPTKSVRIWPDSQNNT